MSSYTTTTNKLKITELDFDSIKSSLTSYLKGQDEFKDYDFTGSAMNILLDVLSYNTHYNGFYVNMLASEMFMDSASLRSSVVSLAKHLGYTPASRKGAFTTVDTTMQGSGSDIVLPRNTKFTSRIGTDVYTFLSTESHVAKLDSTDGLYKASGIKIKEGVAFTSTQTVTGQAGEVFTIPNENVDIDTLVVAVGGQVYLKADDITDLDSTSKVYFLQEGHQNLYEVYFGNGVIGQAPEVSDLVQMEYNVSFLGKAGNGAKVFTFADSVPGASTFTVTLAAGYTRASGGSEVEDVSTIRIQAPRQFALQKRVVTSDDYRARLVNEYNLVDSVRVWGGEDNDPPSYGNVFISIKPKTGYVLSEAERKVIAQDILKKRNMVTITPKFVDPDYLFILPSVVVSYDPRKTSKSPDQIKALVTTAIQNYSTNSLDRFDEYFRHSVLSRTIDDSDTSITNSTNEILLKKRLRPLIGQRGTYVVKFNNELYHPHAGHMNILTSSRFTFQFVDNCSFVDNNGIIMVVTDEWSPENSYSAGENQNTTILNKNVGRINYTSGKIEISRWATTKIADGSNYVYLAVKPNMDDVIPLGNTILTIDGSDIDVTVVNDTDRLPHNKVQGY
jgi:hypothetical protein